MGIRSAEGLLRAPLGFATLQIVAACKVKFIVFLTQIFKKSCSHFLEGLLKGKVTQILIGKIIQLILSGVYGNLILMHDVMDAMIAFRPKHRIALK